MKEYICKEDIFLKERMFGNAIGSLNDFRQKPIITEYDEGWNDCYDEIKAVYESETTVTKADICREFGREVIKRYRADSTKGFANIMSEILGEMEERE